MLAAVFVSGGVAKLTHFQASQELLGLRGLPLRASLVALAAAAELAGGACLIFGTRVRLAALLLAFYLIPVTALFHRGPEQGVQRLKNIAIFGGLLMAVAHGGGAFSLDARLRETLELRKR